MTNAFSKYVPASAIDYCQHLWQHYGFLFRVANPRRTRLGDFRVLPDRQTQITVNSNLNPYAFLITYVHEVAHADVHRRFVLQKRVRRVKPHGVSWQTAFRRLMQPLLTETIFPETVLQPLRQYMSKPGATTYANPALMLALRQFDALPSEAVPTTKHLLRDVPEHTTFQMAQKIYVRGTLRRTRVVCKEVTSGKSYAILAHAWVEINEECSV